MRNRGRISKVGWAMVAVASWVGCGGGAEGAVKRADAEFNPATAANAFLPIDELNPAVAQIFTVGFDGRLEEFQLVITDGESADDGVVRITVQPAPGGVIDPDPNASLIDPILVDTSTLPAVLVEEFTTFDIGDEPGRDVLVGDQLALVVEFVSRATSVDNDAIVRVLGRLTGTYAGGNGATGALGVAFTNNTDDYFFRTFVLVSTSN
ncbi:MAG: hypothetical protein R3F35_03500 [Myxococcota bacterium]